MKRQDSLQLFAQAIGQSLLETPIELLRIFAQQQVSGTQVLTLAQARFSVYQLHQAVSHQIQVLGFVLGKKSQGLRNQHARQPNRRARGLCGSASSDGSRLLAVHLRPVWDQKSARAGGL